MDNAQPAHRPLDRNVMLLSVFLVLAVAALFTVKPWRRQQVAWGADIQASLAAAKQNSKPVFVEVYATWCGPCRHMERDTFTDSEVGSRLAGLNPVLLNYDNESQHRLATKWGVVALPSHILLAPNGSVKAIAVGYMPPDRLLEWLTRHGA